jgi:hypothetical protein
MRTLAPTDLMNIRQAIRHLENSRHYLRRLLEVPEICPRIHNWERWNTESVAVETQLRTILSEDEARR